MNNTTTRNIVVAVLVVVAVVAAWYGFSRKPKTALVSPSSTASESATPIVVPALTYGTAPADWAVYSSSTLGFKVAYPKDWKRGTCGATCVTFAEPSNIKSPLVGVNISASGSLADIIASAKPYIEASGSVDFNGLKWTRLVLREPQTGNVFISHFATSGKKLIELGLGVINEATVKTYGEIVRSFSLSK